MSAKQTKTPASIGEAGVLYGFDPTNNNIINAAKINANGAIAVTGISGGGGGGSSDTTEATQLLVKTAVESINTKTPALIDGATPVTDAGKSFTVDTFNAKLRDAFQTYPGTNWTTVTQASGDIVMIDGNAGGASYLSVSLDPLSSNTSTWIESASTFSMPVDAAFGVHMSQRTLGQEFSVELVSTETPIPTQADLAIASISQTTTTLSVTTSLVHNLRVGARIGIVGVADSRFNYPSLVIATTPTPTTFTATAGPAGALPSVTAGPFSGGVVYSRSAIGGAPNGTSMLFENPTVTNGTLYVKAEGGDPMPIGGTLNGNHSVTLSTTASIQAINAALNYAFRPTTEFRLSLLADRLQWSDVGVDSVGQSSSRGNITQVVPNPDATYKIRFRATNNKALTVPVAHIQAVAKTGTTTATITTQTPHGLTTGDLIAAYGVRDQTNFANLTAATVVASIIDSTNFTVIWGSAVTAASQSGVIYRVNGNNLPSQLGANAITIQTFTRTSNVVTVTGTGSWAGLLIGDYINLAALHDTAGTDLSVDGAYRVRDIQTTSLFLEPIGSTPTGIDIASTNCGGMVIKRTDFRLSFVRLFDFERVRVETLSRPLSDMSSSMPVVVQNIPAVAQSGTWTVNATATQGPVAALGVNNAGSWPVRNAAVRTIDVASAAITTTQTSAAIDVTGNNGAQQFTLDVTAVSGTLPRCYFRVQESFDGGTNFVTTFDLPPAINTTDKTHATPVLPVLGTHCRYVRTVTGTTPSITNSVTRTERVGETARTRRQLVDRVVNLTVTTASTEFLYIDGCSKGQIVLTLGTATTAPTLKVQVCDDVSNNGWYDVTGATVAGTASTTVASAIFDLPPGKFARLVPTVAGSVITADSYTLMLKAWAA